MRKVQPGRSFTLIELLVVVAIIAVLMGILLPTLTRVRQAALKAACSSNMRQIGMAVQMYRSDHSDKFPSARYMPPPFISTNPDPPLPVVLSDSLTGSSKIFKCPGDRDYVHKICGTSYTYNASLAGRQLEDSWFSRRLEYSPSEIPVSYDCDGYRFDLVGGSHIDVPAFHMLRNLLFADGHVGNYK